MGAHNLGRCRKASSGFDGSWTIRRENYFNNGFHRLMRANFWAEFTNKPNLPNDQVDKKFQFNVWGSHKWKVGMFLNTDMHFFYDLNTNNMTGTTCRPSSKNFGHMSAGLGTNTIYTFSATKSMTLRDWDDSSPSFFSIYLLL